MLRSADRRCGPCTAAFETNQAGLGPASLRGRKKRQTLLLNMLGSFGISTSRRSRLMNAQECNMLRRWESQMILVNNICLLLLREHKKETIVVLFF